MRRILTSCFFYLLALLVFPQLKNGLGLNLNLGTVKRLNVSLCYERKLTGDLFFRINAGYGNLIPFNTNENTGRLFLMRRVDEPINHAKHLDLIYNGYVFYSQESEITSPEIKIGGIYMLRKFQSGFRSLSGLYVGYQTSFVKISQRYTNYYKNDSLRAEVQIQGVNNYYSWSWINLSAGWKILVASNTTIDLSLEQSLGILFDSRFRRIADYYQNPYSGLQLDFSIGIRQLF